MRVMQHCSRAKLLVVADRPPEFKLLPESRVEFERWTPRTEQAAFTRMSIGLMPLADTDWCNGKCSYKMLCYMSAGLPVVVTAAGMNREVLALGDVGLSAGCEGRVGRRPHRVARGRQPAPPHGRRRTRRGRGAL